VHRAQCAEKLKILREQQRNLRLALNETIVSLNRGAIRMMVYRQFKMYNDPSLNPQLYRRKDYGRERPS